MVDRSISVLDVLTLIRNSPGKYLGSPSIRSLFYTMHGMVLLDDMLGERLLSATDKWNNAVFSTYVALRQGRRPGAQSYMDLVLEECSGDDGAAFRRFFEYLDTFLSVDPVDSLATEARADESRGGQR